MKFIERYQFVFWALFLFACFAPGTLGQGVSVLLPVVMILLFFRSFSLRFIGFFTLGIITSTLSSYFLGEAHGLNIAIGVLTLSSFLILAWCTETKYFVLSKIDFYKSVLLVAFVQGVIGLYQFVHAFLNDPRLWSLSYPPEFGDSVVGTVGSNSHSFAFQMFAMGLFLVFAREESLSPFLKRAGRWVGYLCFFLFAQSSANHLNIALVTGFFLALLISGLISKVSFRNFKKEALAFVSILFFFGVFQAGNFTYVGRLASEAIRFVWHEPEPVDFKALPQYAILKVTPAPGELRHSHLGKVQVALRTVDFLIRDEPMAGIFGLGLGHYSSRAALIMTGKYLKTKLGFEPYISSPTQKIIMPVWFTETVYPDPNGEGGIASQPFFSWQSLWAETGIVGVAMVFYLLLLGLWQNRRFTFVWLLGFVFAACFFDNWLEFPRAMVVTFLVLKIWYDEETLKGPNIKRLVL